MGAKARQALEGGVEHVELERGGEPTKAQPFGDGEGVEVVGLAPVRVGALQAVHQLWVEGVDLPHQRGEDGRLREETGQVPPVQVGGFHPDPHPPDAVRLGQRQPA